MGRKASTSLTSQRWHQTTVGVFLSKVKLQQGPVSPFLILRKLREMVESIHMKSLNNIKGEKEEVPQFPPTRGQVFLFYEVIPKRKRQIQGTNAP